MKYMLLICRDEQAWDRLSEAERQQIYAESVALSEELAARGQYLGGYPLHPLVDRRPASGCATASGS